jgi:hypothetical protein
LKLDHVADAAVALHLRALQLLLQMLLMCFGLQDLLIPGGLALGQRSGAARRRLRRSFPHELGSCRVLPHRALRL